MKIGTKNSMVFLHARSALTHTQSVFLFAREAGKKISPPPHLPDFATFFVPNTQLQLISYKRYVECTLVQWRLSINPWAQVAVGTFFMKSPVSKKKKERRGAK